MDSPQKTGHDGVVEGHDTGEGRRPQEPVREGKLVLDNVVSHRRKGKGDEEGGEGGGKKA